MQYYKWVEKISIKRERINLAASMLEPVSREEISVSNLRGRGYGILQFSSLTILFAERGQGPSVLIRKGCLTVLHYSEIPGDKHLSRSLFFPRDTTGRLGNDFLLYHKEKGFSFLYNLYSIFWRRLEQAFWQLLNFYDIKLLGML